MLRPKQPRGISTYIIIAQNLEHIIENQYKEQNDLYTSGDELQDKNSKIYIGYYHVNKILGPMEGKFHQKTPHKKLSFISGSGLESQLLIETSYDPPSPTPPSTIGTRGGGY